MSVTWSGAPPTWLSTSAASAGCHLAIREWGAECVTSAADVLSQLSFGLDEAASGPGGRGPVLPRDELDPVSRDVLEAVPARTKPGMAPGTRSPSPAAWPAS